MQEKTEIQGIAEAMEDDYVPSEKTIKILKGVSRHFGIEMNDIKVRYKEIIKSEEAEKEGVDLGSTEKWAVRRLIWLLNDENEIDNYEREIDQYCDLISELAIINDKMARTSVEISRVFGEKYSFVAALKEVYHVRQSLENRMYKNLFGGE